MSHDIRTPMNAIMSAGEIMLAKEITEDTRLNVHHITNACRALITTLDDLLVFSDIGAYSVTEGIYLFLGRDMPKIIMYNNGQTRLVRNTVNTWKINMPEDL